MRARPVTGEKRTPRVVGLDLSLTATGICTGAVGSPHPAEYSASTVDPGTRPDPARMAFIRDQVLWHTGDARTGGAVVDLVLVEGFSFASKGNALYQIGGLGWIIRLALTEAKVPWVLVTPSQLKLYATGKGSGKGTDKIAMGVAAMERAGVRFEDDNQCDAWWLRLMGLDHYGVAPLKMPEKNREALAKVAWPR